jgi:ADP-ribose pyrophosphatase YjhB (NUDIX family)
MQKCYDRLNVFENEGLKEILRRKVHEETGSEEKVRDEYIVYINMEYDTG